MLQNMSGGGNQRKDQRTVPYLSLIHILNPLTYVIANLAILGIIWFGGMRVDGGVMTQGEIIALVNYMTQILLALIVLANLVIIFTKAQASAVRVNEVFALHTSIRETPATPAASDRAAAGKIEFQNASFSYPQSSEYALRSLSIVIESGQTVGVIGGTGSGKSTLAGLIPRLFDVTAVSYTHLMVSTSGNASVTRP